MKTRILQLILTAMFCVTSVGAQSLLMRHRDGTVTDIPLSAAPILETADGNIAVTTNDGSSTYDNNEVLAIMFQTPRSDVNRDYHTDISDVVSVINAMAGDDTYKDVSDVNGDNKTDISDVVAVINSIAGKKNDLPLPSFAPDQTSAIGDAFYIYRNDGEFNAFLRYEVDNISFDLGNSLIQTADSVYEIPLVAIDSISFVQPETVYRPETVQLTGQLLNYVDSVDSMTIMFSPQTPLMMLPKVGDKIATMEFTDRFPAGFVGVVTDVTSTDAGYAINCDYVDLEEVVSRFYGVVELVKGEDDEENAEDETSGTKPRRAPVHSESNSFNFDIPEIHIPMGLPSDLPGGLDLSAIIKTKQIGDFSPNAMINYYIKPNITGKVTRVIDSFLALSYVELHAVSDIQTKIGFDITGEITNEIPNLPAFKKLWLIYMVPVYLCIEPKIELNFPEVAFGSTISCDYHNTLDIRYYPATSLIPVTSFANRINQHSSLDNFKFDLQYLAAHGSINAGGDIKFGIPLGVSGLKDCLTEFGPVRVDDELDLNWAGIQIDLGMKAEFDFMFDFEEFHNADKESRFYDGVKNANATIMPYHGYHLVAEFDKVEWQIGKDFSFFGFKFYDDKVLPHFDNVKFELKNGSERNAVASASLSCGGLFSIPVGFAVLDYNDSVVIGPKYFEREYKKQKDFPDYKIEFDNLPPGKNYRACPVIKLFNRDVLASPSAELKTEFPVEITSFEVTKSQYKQGAFTHKNKQYDYRFDAATTVECVSVDGIADWGYVYEDLDSEVAHISLKSHASPYTDTNYAYFRNTPVSYARLYGYVKYEGDEQYYYGESHNYPLVCEEPSLCPDSNHPHAIDLGIGVKWSCCNVGASAPWEYGGYYAWGETEEKSSYSNDTYAYYKSGRCTGIGSNIAGTRYDVAHVNWGSGWLMPDKSQMEALNNQCSSEWTTVQGVYGRKFTGPNGASIFIPAAGDKWRGTTYDVNTYGYYWTSVQLSDGLDYAHDLYFNKDDSYIDFASRTYGRSVRPVKE